MDEIDKLWLEYSKTKNSEVKDKLIIEYAQLVKFVAGRLNLKLGQYVDFDDLVGYGVFGLIDAIEKFDYDKGIKFETYASLRIRGSILDSIRKTDWVPRSVRQQSKEIENAFTKYEQDNGKLPTDKELADSLNITIEEAREGIKKAAISSLISLDEYTENSNNQVIKFDNNDNSTTPESEYDLKEAKEILLKALETLNEKEKHVINLYYFDELTLKEISKILDVTESRISQIHSKAILKLNTKLGKYKNILLTD